MMLQPEILISLKLQKNSAAYPNQSHIRSLPSLHHRWPPTTTLHLMLQSESVVIHSWYPTFLSFCTNICSISIFPFMSVLIQVGKTWIFSKLFFKSSAMFSHRNRTTTVKRCT
nr:hypothetical protein Iba_scaffold1112CG0060 [Ipomoea batatas]